MYENQSLGNFLPTEPISYFPYLFSEKADADFFPNYLS